jgi:hypothetical protein
MDVDRNINLTNLDRLRILGEALHGPRWQNAVARDLGINPRQVHRWASGEYQPHEGHISDLIGIAQERQLMIVSAIEHCGGN